MRSIPRRPRRNAATTHTTAGITAVTVPAIQHPSATRGAWASQATPPAASPATVSATRIGSIAGARRSRAPGVTSSMLCPSVVLRARVVGARAAR